jgi:hypothetical protein
LVRNEKTNDKNAQADEGLASHCGNASVEQDLASFDACAALLGCTI